MKARPEEDRESLDHSGCCTLLYLLHSWCQRCRTQHQEQRRRESKALQDKDESMSQELWIHHMSVARHKSRSRERGQKDTNRTEQDRHRCVKIRSRELIKRHWLNVITNRQTHDHEIRSEQQSSRLDRREQTKTTMRQDQRKKAQRQPSISIHKQIQSAVLQGQKKRAA